mmetsp:Transcript_15449/g.32554  ORF Transcript_15449/g.32554 Transcript_15449/m.32554 type:complete len:230 (+) Transcript_15449:1363-2052(+)
MQASLMLSRACARFALARQCTRAAEACNHASSFTSGITGTNLVGANEGETSGECFWGDAFHFSTSCRNLTFLRFTSLVVFMWLHRTRTSCVDSSRATTLHLRHLSPQSASTFAPTGSGSAGANSSKLSFFNDSGIDLSAEGHPHAPEVSRPCKTCNKCWVGAAGFLVVDQLPFRHSSPLFKRKGPDHAAATASASLSILAPACFNSCLNCSRERRPLLAARTTEAKPAK